MMQMGMDGVFVGSGIFKSGDAPKRARAIVQVLRLTLPPLPDAAHSAATCPRPSTLTLILHGVCRASYHLAGCSSDMLCLVSMQAVTHYQDAKIIGEVSKGLGEAMVRFRPRELL